MKIEDPNNPGEEIEVFTPDEVAAKDAAIAENTKALADAKAEVERLNQHTALQKDNFKKLNEMSETERASLSAEKIEAMKRFEAAEARAAALETKLNDDTKKRIETDTEKALAQYHGGDPKLKEQLEKNFKLINLEGTDTETIQERARLAKNMLVGSSEKPNPLYASMNGGAPRSEQKSKSEEFLKSDKAAEALKRMGEATK